VRGSARSLLRVGRTTEIMAVRGSATPAEIGAMGGRIVVQCIKDVRTFAEHPIKKHLSNDGME
jgi:hypothetical protein